MNALPDDLRDILRRLEAGLKEFYGDRFRALLLYGSYARGEAREGSDVDLLLLLKGPVHSGREIVRLQEVKWPLSLEADLTLSVIPISIEDFEEAKTMFLRTVRREAIPAAA